MILPGVSLEKSPPSTPGSWIPSLFALYHFASHDLTILCRVVAQELGMVKAAEVGLALLGPSSQHLGPKAFSNASWLPGTPH